jgi:hypothetical protein
MSLAIDQDTFNAQFARAPFLVPHRLARHTLFTLACLVELSKRLPASQVEYNAGEVPVGLDPARTPRNGLTPEETIRRIAECRSWLVLKHVERDPAYRLLLDTASPTSGRPRPGSPRACAIRTLHFRFVARRGDALPHGPGGELPAPDPRDQDHERVRPRRPAVVSEPEIERFLSGAHRNLAWREEFQRRARTFDLEPGLALHVPFASPHWVQNGPEVSISFSVTFNTALRCGACTPTG